MGILPSDCGEDNVTEVSSEKDFLPVVYVSYSDLRGTLAGSGWPEQGHQVDENSFLGILRERTGLEFDLPTEAQWEYACRAGTTSALNSGKELMPISLEGIEVDINFNEVGFCSSSYRLNDKKVEYGYVTVGRFLPNRWGLYDMHGNVEEWCLDWIPGIYSRHVGKNPADGLTPLVDPGGYQWNEKDLLHRFHETPFRVVRGGYRFPSLCRAAARKGADYRKGSYCVGFRLVSNGPVTAEVASLHGQESISSDQEASLETLQHIPANPQQYLVIDLSGGPEATRYPYRHTDTPPDLSDDRCRTTELWLRRIPPGTFVMGSPEGEVGRNPTRERQHLVTLSKDFYIGVFEVTRRQWELVAGRLPEAYSHKSNRFYMEDTRRDDERMATPVAEVAYSDIRGNDVGAFWPEQGHQVDENSFLGILRERTGLEFDLPTEAQWEYACRAGTTTSLNSGEDMLIVTDRDRWDYHLDKVGCYKFNCPYANGRQYPVKVGSFQPNRWGLYDMHGNVWEWCLDWHYSEGTSANNGRVPIVDPVGGRVANRRSSTQEKLSAMEELRVARGGCYARGPAFCRAAARAGFWPFPWTARNDLGFRLVCNELPRTLMDAAQPR